MINGLFTDDIFQRIVKMNKMEDDELEARELTAEELQAVTGVYQILVLYFLNMLVEASHP